MSPAPPRLVVAAPSSGAGKTTVATGLMAALARRGLVVSGHKVGPDYIDPGYHALATGRPGRNLDPVLQGRELVAPLFRHGAEGADLAVVEGVMGLYDGRGATDEGSTAQVARLLDAPVVLVVDASSQSRSVAALVHGFSSYDGGVRLGGVVLNRIGSDGHEALLREVLAGSGVPVLGALRRHDAVATPSRHLGLVPVAERASAAAVTVEALAELVTRSVDLDAVLALAGSAGPLPGPAWDPAEAVGAPVPGRPVIAMAGGPAFSFAYTETAELLAAAGAHVVTVDPLRDTALPAGSAGLYFGGGFPEEHAGALAANEPLLAAVRRFAGPVYAECGGLLYLCRSLDGVPMAGRIAADARMTPRLTLGYRDATSALDGSPVTAHEFHRTVAEPAYGATPAYLVGDRPEGWRDAGLTATYLHTHWAATPGEARRLLGARAGAAA